MYTEKTLSPFLKVIKPNKMQDQLKLY